MSCLALSDPTMPVYLDGRCASRISSKFSPAPENVIAARYSRLDLKNTPIKTIFVDKKKVNRDTRTKPEI